MIKIDKKQYNSIKNIVKDLDNKLKSDNEDDIIDDICTYLCSKYGKTDEPYSDEDTEIERVMDYINYNYG